MFFNALAETHRQHGELVSMCDLSQVRMDYYNRRLREQHGHPPIPTFKPDAFEEMIRQTRPDTVIVCTVDSNHHEYIVRSMEAGLDVICEKPMTVDASKARAIHDAIQRTGRSLRVTFNLRYTPLATRIRELIVQGVIGKPMAVDMTWVLDTSHGADYFRRWHREKEKSGGLLVHKATHHFDLVNWWIDSQPQTVFAMGDLKFYGKANAQARGEHYEYDRYTGEPGATSDPFALHLDSFQGEDQTQSLYLDAEHETGYVRDRNVFSDGVSIEDTMSVVARFDNGVVLTYSLIAYSPWEGFRAAITGNKGRIEVYVKQSSHIVAGQGENESADAHADEYEETLMVFPMFDNPYRVDVPKGEGAHGGGDSILLDQLFSPHPIDDPLGRAASHIDGTTSMLLGVCANQSILTGQPVDCRDVLDMTTLADAHESVHR